MKVSINPKSLKIVYYTNPKTQTGNAKISYNGVPFTLETEELEIENGLEKNENGKWFIRPNLTPSTKSIIEEINKNVRNDIIQYWGKGSEFTVKVSDCLDYTLATSTKMYLKVKYRYKKFETKAFDQDENPANIYQLNKDKKAKLHISLNSAYKEKDSVVLLWTVDKIIYSKQVSYI